ncbi:MAG: hypothetical protein ABII06_04740 [Pseudomonadota bacterium]
MEPEKDYGTAPYSFWRVRTDDEDDELVRELGYGPPERGITFREVVSYLVHDWQKWLGPLLFYGGYFSPIWVPLLYLWYKH